MDNVVDQTDTKEELEEEDLLSVNAQKAYEESVEETPTLALKREVTQKEFTETFPTSEILKQQCIDADFDEDRSTQISALSSYLEIYKKRREENTLQTTLTRFFTQKN